MNTDLDLPYLNLTIESDILIGTYKDDIHITLSMAKDIVNNRLLFTEKKKMPCLIISKGVVSIEKSAREFLASTEGTEGLTASAIYVKSSFSSFLGNFFIIVNKTEIPVKLFTDLKKAKKWLTKYIN